MQTIATDLSSPTEILTIREAAREVKSGTRPLYRAAKAGELRAAVINDRGDLRTTREWLRDWLARRAATRAA